MVKQSEQPETEAELKAALRQEFEYLGKIFDELERLKETAIHTLELPMHGDSLETLIGKGLEVMEELEKIANSL